MHSRPDGWSDDFAAFAPDAIEHLAELGVVLVGLDTPSIDPASSKTLDSHQVIRRLDMRVLENLALDAVPAGDYELIALPLALADRSEEHTSELQSLMRISYAVFCLKKKKI